MDNILNVVNPNPLSLVMQYNGLIKVKKCKWCYNIIYKGQENFCCKDCSQEFTDFNAVKRTLKNRGYAKAQYMRNKNKTKTPEEKLKDKLRKRKYYLKNKQKILDRNKSYLQRIKNQKVELLKQLNKIK